MKCPFVYSNGKECDGYVKELKIIKANIRIYLTQDNRVTDINFYTPYHVHLYCSKKGNHAGYRRLDPPEMKIWFNELPEEIQEQILRICEKE